MIELLFLEMKENCESVEILPEQDRVEFWPPWECQALALLPSGPRDELCPVAIMGVFLGFDKTVVNGIRIGVLKDNFRSSRHPVKEIIVSTTVRMIETAFSMMDSNVRIGKDLCGLLTEEIDQAESMERRDQVRHESDQGADEDQSIEKRSRN